ncbi:MAG: V-type ATP synthase subunit I, partial [Dehalococcoidia bacterium]|nr:V-type ATP synthase subunit I [Dehalococcoidia bacterium]
MLRPKQMSRISVTGSKEVMEEFINTIHELNAIHFVEYDGSWSGFQKGNPGVLAEEVSERLVTARAIESILGIEAENFEYRYEFKNGEIKEKLEELREKVNRLEDRRTEIVERMRRVEELLVEAEVFIEIGIDFDLLKGYKAVDVFVGRGSVEKIKEALSRVKAPIEMFAGENSIAIVAETDSPEVSDALERTEFERVEIPDRVGEVGRYFSDLENEEKELVSELESIKIQMEEIKNEVKLFLLATEEKLSIDVQRTEAPLLFATTENTFTAEGWIPTVLLHELNEKLEESVGNHMAIEELERAEYDAEGFVEHGEAVGQSKVEGDTKMGRSEPPVIQDNPTSVQPFEVLVQTIGRPKYSELDPTLIIFLTFPAFFGFMIGDVGYGICYAIIGYLLMSKSDSIGIKSLGGVTIWAGIFTILFGVFYGEFFGMHIVGELIWGGHPPIEKGLSPKTAHFALLWLVVAMLIGIVHVSIGYTIDFINKMRHSIVDAVLESGSWILLMLGVWTWVFSTHLRSVKPDLLFVQLSKEPLAFTGFSPETGLLALGIAFVGLVLMIIGEIKHQGALGAIIGILESPNVLVNILSYARIPAVLLAKAGMAFVVNLLVF